MTRYPGFFTPEDQEWNAASWEQAGRPLTLERYGALCRLMRTVTGYGRTVDWYDQPAMWHGLTPRQLEAAGLLDEVEARLWGLADGGFS